MYTAAEVWDWRQAASVCHIAAKGKHHLLRLFLIWTSHMLVRHSSPWCSISCHSTAMVWAM